VEVDLSDTSEIVKVDIPRSLYEKLQDKIKGTEFKSVHEYLSFLIAQVLEVDVTKSAQGLSQEDEDQIKKKLEALGYL
jgi:Arc/MetJ-type ribon-helix-helix transcriptional regulator